MCCEKLCLSNLLIYFVIFLIFLFLWDKSQRRQDELSEQQMVLVAQLSDKNFSDDINSLFFPPFIGTFVDDKQKNDGVLPEMKVKSNLRSNIIKCQKNMEGRRSSSYQVLHKNRRTSYFYDYLWYPGDIYG